MVQKRDPTLINETKSSRLKFIGLTGRNTPETGELRKIRDIKYNK